MILGVWGGLARRLLDHYDMSNRVVTRPVVRPAMITALVPRQDSYRDSYSATADQRPHWRRPRLADDDKKRRESSPPGTAVITKTKPQTKRPSLYRVLILNDDYTPMEFVVDVLEKFFRMDRTTATRVMLEVHTQGKGICGVFTYEIAETKVALVTSYARDHHHPLMCTLEEA